MFSIASVVLRFLLRLKRISLFCRVGLNGVMAAFLIEWLGATCLRQGRASNKATPSGRHFSVWLCYRSPANLPTLVAMVTRVARWICVVFYLDDGLLAGDVDAVSAALSMLQA